MLAALDLYLQMLRGALSHNHLLPWPDGWLAASAALIVPAMGLEQLLP